MNQGMIPNMGTHRGHVIACATEAMLLLLWRCGDDFHLKPRIHFVLAGLDQALAPGKRQALLKQAPSGVAVRVFVAAVNGMVSVGPLAAGDLNAKIVELQELPHLKL